MSGEPDTTQMVLGLQAEEFVKKLEEVLPGHKFHVILMSAGTEGTRLATNALSAPLSVVWSWAEQLVQVGRKLKDQVKQAKKKRTH